MTCWTGHLGVTSRLAKEDEVFYGSTGVQPPRQHQGKKIAVS